MKTTLRNIGDISLEDFSVSKQDYYEMLEAQQFEQEVEVLDNEAGWGYYDVILPSGRTVYSLSWYHLNGYNSPFAK